VGAGSRLHPLDYSHHPVGGQQPLRVSTTGGNELRELQQQLLQDQLSEAGFDLDIDNPPGPDFFGERPFSVGNLACAVSQGDHGASVPLSFDEEAVADCEVVDIAQFTYVGGPWPGDGNIVFRGGYEQNMYGYANADLDQLMDQCEVIVDDDDRAACYNKTDQYVTTRLEDDNGLIILPLTVKPNFFAFSNTTMERAPVVVDANEAGPLVHAVDFLPSG
jgi:peptide/nickel transport system substrate-binding protein